MPLSKKQLQAVRSINFDLFSDWPERAEESTAPVRESVRTAFESRRRLPSEAELSDLFDGFNREYFGGRLTRPRISYSDRMLIAGNFSPLKNEIRIGRKYHEIFPGEIEDTLKHEMIHLICLNHNRTFKEIAARIGASVRARSHPSLRGSYKYLYYCPHCGQEYPRRKRLRMASCGLCSPGRVYDPRFKLKLKKSGETGL